MIMSGKGTHMQNLVTSSSSSSSSSSAAAAAAYIHKKTGDKINVRNYNLKWRLNLKVAV